MYDCHTCKILDVWNSGGRLQRAGGWNGAAPLRMFHCRLEDDGVPFPAGPLCPRSSGTARHHRHHPGDRKKFVLLMEIPIIQHYDDSSSGSVQTSILHRSGCWSIAELPSWMHRHQLYDLKCP